MGSSGKAASSTFAVAAAVLVTCLSGVMATSQPAADGPTFSADDYPAIKRNPDLRLLVERDPMLLRHVLDVIKGGGDKDGTKPPDNAQGISISEITPTLCNEMKKKHVLNSPAPVGCDRLRLVKFAYIDFDGRSHDDGEIIVLDAIASHVEKIFAALRDKNFPIARAKLVDAYNGNDDASMADNNTSSFNVRPITGGKAVSLHAYGLAIDLNPVQNPYVRRAIASNIVSPKSGSEFLDRKTRRPGMAESVGGIFADHGLTIWGGTWTNPTDYQHFQVGQKLASQLAALPAAEATALFEQHVQNDRACAQADGQSGSAHPSCSALD
jgi:D-alanyl-D-alanine carboxypeptidase